MISVSTETSDSKLALTRAMLLYEEVPSQQGGYRSGGNAHFVTVHSVTHEGPTPQLGPGAPITHQDLNDLVSGITKGAGSLGMAWLPPNVLAKTELGIAWWVPESKARIHFDCQELGKRSAIVPHPPRVFALVQNALYVWACKEDNRPGPATEMYRSGYFNVNPEGVVCQGSMEEPEGAVETRLRDWERSFNRSAFTHPNVHAPQKLTLHPKGAYAFWRDMLDGKYDKYPRELLVGMKRPLGDVLKGVDR